MDSTSLNALAEDLLGRARAAHSGRTAHTVFGGTGHLLRETAIALLVEQAQLRAWTASTNGGHTPSPPMTHPRTGDLHGQAPPASGMGLPLICWE